MADCECLIKCPFFNDQMSKTPATSLIFKKRYCQSDATTCARYMVFKALGSERVPSDLYPNEPERVQRIIADS